jgi:hypothetical protein
MNHQVLKVLPPCVNIVMATHRRWWLLASQYHCPLVWLAYKYE